MQAAVNQSFLRQVAHVDQPHLEDETTLVLSYGKIGPALVDARKLGTRRRLERVETVFLDHNQIETVANVCSRCRVSLSWTGFGTHNVG